MAKIATIILFTMTILIIIMAQKPVKPPTKNPKKGGGKPNKTGENKGSTTYPTFLPTPTPTKQIKKPTMPPSPSLISAPNIYTKSEPTISPTDQCCSDDCCVSLTYSRSVAKKEDFLPQLLLQSNGTGYFCENMDIFTTGNCDIDFIVFPLSSHCNLKQKVYNMRWVTQSQDAIGYQRSVVENNTVSLNNAEMLYIDPNDSTNPILGFDALKFPVNLKLIPNQQISMCTLVGFGDIVDNINGQAIHIGYMGTNNGFACPNATIRDICSVSVDVDVLFDAEGTYDAKDTHLKFAGGVFSNLKHGGYVVVILIVCFVSIIEWIICECYQKKRVSNNYTDYVDDEAESLHI